MLKELTVRKQTLECYLHMRPSFSQMPVIVFVKQMAQVNVSGQRPPTRPQAAEIWVPSTPAVVPQPQRSENKSVHLLHIWGHEIINKQKTDISMRWWWPRIIQMFFTLALKFSGNISCICIICFPPSFLFLCCLNQWIVKSFRNLQDILEQVIPKNRIKMRSCKGNI